MSICIPAPLGLSGLRKVLPCGHVDPQDRRGVWPAKLALHIEGGGGLEGSIPAFSCWDSALSFFFMLTLPLVPGTREAWT